MVLKSCLIKDALCDFILMVLHNQETESGHAVSHSPLSPWPSFRVPFGAVGVMDSQSSHTWVQGMWQVIPQSPGLLTL